MLPVWQLPPRAYPIGAGALAGDSRAARPLPEQLPDAHRGSAARA